MRKGGTLRGLSDTRYPIRPTRTRIVIITYNERNIGYTFIGRADKFLIENRTHGQEFKTKSIFAYALARLPFGRALLL